MVGSIRLLVPKVNILDPYTLLLLYSIPLVEFQNVGRSVHRLRALVVAGLFSRIPAVVFYRLFFFHHRWHTLQLDLLLLDALQLAKVWRHVHTVYECAIVSSFVIVVKVQLFRRRIGVLRLKSDILGIVWVHLKISRTQVLLKHPVKS